MRSQSEHPCTLFLIPSFRNFPQHDKVGLVATPYTFIPYTLYLSKSIAEGPTKIPLLTYWGKLSSRCKN